MLAGDLRVAMFTIAFLAFLESSQVSSLGKDLGYDAAEVANALGLEPRGNGWCLRESEKGGGLQNMFLPCLWCKRKTS